MDKLREWFPANRIIALIGLFTAIGVVIASFQTSLVPGSPAAEALAKAAGVVAGVITALGIVLKFLDGAQNYDSLMLSGAPKVKGVTVVATTNATDIDTGAVTEDQVLAYDEEDPADDHPPVSEYSDEERAQGFSVGTEREPSTSPPLLEGEDAQSIGEDSGEPPLRPVD